MFLKFLPPLKGIMRGIKPDRYHFTTISLLTTICLSLFFSPVAYSHTYRIYVWTGNDGTNHADRFDLKLFGTKGNTGMCDGPDDCFTDSSYPANQEGVFLYDDTDIGDIIGVRVYAPDNSECTDVSDDCDNWTIDKIEVKTSGGTPAFENKDFVITWDMNDPSYKCNANGSDNSECIYVTDWSAYQNAYNNSPEQGIAWLYGAGAAFLLDSNGEVPMSVGSRHSNGLISISSLTSLTEAKVEIPLSRRSFLFKADNGYFGCFDESGAHSALTNSNTGCSSSPSAWTQSARWDQHKPEARNVSISGTLKSGETLTGSYTYYDSEEDQAQNPEFTWYRSGSASCSSKTALAGAKMVGVGKNAKSEYKLTDNENGYYICFEVVAKANAGLPASSPEIFTTSTKVAKLPQSITFSSLVNKIYEDLPFSVGATASSGLSVSYSTSGKCTNSGNQITITGAGSCTVTASQDGDYRYEAASPVERSFSIDQKDQAITSFTVPASKTYEDPPFAISAQGYNGVSNASNPLLFETSDECSYSGGQITINSAGPCHITVTQEGNDDYKQASATKTVLINKQTQALSVSQPANLTYAPGASVTITAMGGNSTSPISYTTSGSNTSGNSDTICSVSNLTPVTISIQKAGTCTITTTQTGDGNYHAATPVVNSFSILKAYQAITGFDVSDKVYGETFTINAVGGGSGNQVTLQTSGVNLYGYPNNDVCTVPDPVNAPLTVQIGNTGTCTITASQSGDNNYYSAPSLTDSFQVSKALQSVTFNNLSHRTYEDPPFTVNAVGGGSNNPIILTVSGFNLSGVPDTAVCHLSDTDPMVIEMEKAGNCTVFASQDGGENYNNAVSPPNSFVIARAPQVITGFNPPTAKTFGDAAVTLSAGGGNSGNPVTYSSLTTDVCTVTNNSVSIVGSGLCSVQADQLGNDDYYLAAPSVRKDITVERYTQTISGFTVPSTKVYGDAPFTLSASGNPLGSPIVFSSSTTDVCQVAGDQVTLLNAGTCTLTAARAGDSNHVAVSTTKSINVERYTQTISSFTVPSTKMYGNAPFTISASGNPFGFPIILSSTTTYVCQVTGGQVTLLNAGLCTIKAARAGDPNHVAISIVKSINVTKPVLTITADDKTRYYGEANPALTLSYSGFVNGENQSVLDIPPTVSTVADINSGAGNYDIVCQAGSDNNYTINCNDGSLTINKAVTTTMITADHPDPSPLPQNVTVQFTVTPNSGNNPTGTVTVSDGIDSCSTNLTLMDGGVGSCMMTFSSGAGDKTLSANYAGDARFVGSTSSGETHTVDAIGIVVTETLDPGKSLPATIVQEGIITDTYTINLTTEPSAPVIITLTPDPQLRINGQNAGQPLTLTFNDHHPQTITVDANDDSVVEGLYTALISHEVMSNDPDYDQRPVANVSVQLYDDDPGLILEQTDGSTDIGEGQANDIYSVKLATIPLNQVTVTLTTDGQSTVLPATLTFAADETALVPQVVTISSVNDLIDDHSAIASVQHNSASADNNYNGASVVVMVDGQVSTDLTVNIPDNDVAGVIIEQTESKNYVEEGGVTDTYRIRLNSQPLAPVSITPTVDPTQVSLSPATLTFADNATALNWQTITLTAVNDLIDDGSPISTIEHAITSADSYYNDADGVAITLDGQASSSSTLSVNVTDNDTSGVIIEQSDGSTQLTEGGSNETYTIRLNSQPVSPVTISLTIDAQQMTVSPTTLTFLADASALDTQTITVTAVDDLIDDGSPISTIEHATTSVDSHYNDADGVMSITLDGQAVPSSTLSVKVTDNDTSGVIIEQSDGSTQLTEGGNSETYTIRLNSQPVGPVTISLTVDAQQMTISPTTLTFLDNASALDEQTITVTAVNDLIEDGSPVSTIEHAITSADSHYNDADGVMSITLDGQAASSSTLSVKVTDNDTSGIIIEQTEATTHVVEGGITDTYRVRLQSQPKNPVTITLNINGEVTVSPTTLIFGTDASAMDWQTVTITAIDDDLDDGLLVSTITNANTSADPAYHAEGAHITVDGEAGNLIKASVADDDTLGVSLMNSANKIVSPINFILSEQSTLSDYYSVVLHSQPKDTDEVIINFSISGSCSTAPEQLIFTTSNWNQPQRVTVSTYDDDRYEIDEGCKIHHRVEGGDYAGIEIADIGVEIRDNDPRPKTHLIIKFEGSGQGSIVTNYQNCHSEEKECRLEVRQFQEMSLVAYPDTGSVFNGWQGDSRCNKESFTLYNDKEITCTANFGFGGRYLTVESLYGTVNSQPAGIKNCGFFKGTCTSTFPGGDEKIQLTAKPDAGWELLGWEGDYCDETGRIKQLVENTTCKAIYVPVPASLASLEVFDYKTNMIIDGSGLDFDTAVGHPITQQVVLSNTHTLSPLFLSDLVLPNGFSKISDFPTRLEPGQKTVFQIQLDAQAIGVYEGLWSFKVGDQKSNQEAGYPMIGVVYDTCPEASEMRVLFVKQGAEIGDGGGCSWNAPFKDLQPALLAIANNKYPKVKEIWVTSGTYKPTTGTDRTASFRLINGVSIYGGFLGTEEKREDRNEHQYQCPAPTILSGDIGVADDASDNSYHVVVAHGVSSSTGIYDVVITGGNANGVHGGSRTRRATRDGANSDNSAGGGMYNNNASLIIDDVLFNGNYAISGGGLFNGNGSTPTISNAAFANNRAENGGGMLNDNSSPAIVKVAFTQNQASNAGGGIVNQNGSMPLLNNVVMEGNEAKIGGGMVNDNSSPSLTMVYFSNNQAVEGGGLVNRNNSAPLIDSAILSNNTATESGGGILNINSQPVLMNSVINDNVAPVGSGIANQAGSQMLMSHSAVEENRDAAGNLAMQIVDDPTSQSTVNNSNVQGGWLGAGTNNSDQALGMGEILESELPLAEIQSATANVAQFQFAHLADPVALKEDEDKDEDKKPEEVAEPLYEAAIIANLNENPPCVGNTVLYVNANVNANMENTGCSWTAPLKHLQVALTVAGTPTYPQVKEIWVASGVYQPTTGNDRQATFSLKNGLAIYGGFAGTETQREARHLHTQQTILSGDIGVSADKSDNSLHVVSATNLDETAILSDVTITGGNANLGDVCPTACGGGIYNNNAAPTLRRLLVRNNAAIYGGGIVNDNSSRPWITQSQFNHNAAVWGAGMVNFTSLPQLDNVLFNDNIASDLGGAMFNRGSRAVINQATFTNNSAPTGSGIVNENSPLFINNSILWGNRSHLMPTAIMPQILDEWGEVTSTINYSMVDEWGEVTSTLNYSMIDEWGEMTSTSIINYSLIEAGWSGAGHHNIADDPLFVQATVGGDFHLMADSPAIDAGNSQTNSSIDFEGNPRIVDGNGDGIAVVDLGAYEFQATTLVNTDTTVTTGDVGTEPANNPLLVSEGDSAMVHSDTTQSSEKASEYEKASEVATTVVTTIKPGHCQTKRVGTFYGVCNAAGERITYSEIDEGSSLANATIDKPLVNHGFVSNLTIIDNGQLQGGTVSGHIINQGMMSDFEFVGASLIGSSESEALEIIGGLGGKITNSSQIGGFIQDVYLMAGTQLSGGIVKGIIQGDPQSPATLSDLTVAANSSLFNLVLEKDVVLEENLVLGDITLKGVDVSQATLIDQVTNTATGTFKDIKLVAGAQLSGGIVQGIIQGDPQSPATLSALTVAANSSLFNLVLEKDVILEENLVLGDVTLQGNDVSQAVLIDQITNTATGTFKDIHLLAGAHLIGGQVSGIVAGEAESPALLESVNILPNTQLSYMILGKGVKGGENIKSGENVWLQLDSIVGLGVDKYNNPAIDIQSVFDTVLSVKERAIFEPEAVVLAQDETLIVKTTLTIDPQHRGQAGELLLALRQGEHYQMRGEESWMTWDTQMAHLQAMKSIDELPESVTIPITLEFLNEDTWLYLGYRLDNGTIVHNGKAPLHIQVGEIIE